MHSTYAKYLTCVHVYHLYANDGTLQVVSKDIRTIELKLTDAFA